MNVLQINTLDNAILFEFQRTKAMALDFSQLWQFGSAVGPNLPEPVSPDICKGMFAQRLIAACEHLYNNGAVELHRLPDGKVRYIRLTEAGKAVVDNVIFSGTNRVPLAYTKPQYKLEDIQWKRLRR